MSLNQSKATILIEKDEKANKRAVFYCPACDAVHPVDIYEERDIKRNRNFSTYGKVLLSGNKVLPTLNRGDKVELYREVYTDDPENKEIVLVCSFTIKRGVLTIRKQTDLLKKTQRLLPIQPIVDELEMRERQARLNKLIQDAVDGKVTLEAQEGLGLVLPEDPPIFSNANVKFPLMFDNAEYNEIE